MFSVSEQEVTRTFLSDKNESSLVKPFFDQIFIGIQFVGDFLASTCETLEERDIIKWT